MKLLRTVAVTVLCVIVLAVVSLLVMGRRPGAGAMSAAVEIGLPRAQVHAWLEEPERLTQWVGWLVRVEREPAGLRQAGGRETWWMDDPNMNERLEIPSTILSADSSGFSLAVAMPGAFEGTWRYTIEGLDSARTRVSGEGRFTYSHWLASLMEPLVTPEAQKKLVADMERLKQKAESAPR